jgi:malonyl-CoA O-methyltransferase
MTSAPQGSDYDRVETRAGYDRWAEIYDGEDNPLVKLEELHVDRLLGDVRKLDVLDHGCGTGRHALRLAERGARVTAVDFSAGMLAKAKRKPFAERVRFLVHDVHEELPFERASFERVVCALVLDHVRDLEGALRDMLRVLRPGGAVVITVMHPALMLRGVSARFTDPASGRETRPASEAHSISDYVRAALAAGADIDAIEEHAVDEQLARTSPRAQKYVGWPVLLALRLVDARARRG